jgi:hypothetical protein
MACCRDGTRAALVLASDSLIDPLEQPVSTANPRASRPIGQSQHPSSSHHPDPTHSTIQRRPQLRSEYRWALPMPMAVLT